MSKEVIEEARKNVTLKIGETEKRLSSYIQFANTRFTDSPTIEEIADGEQYIDKKDAPILAAFLKSPADFMVTLDRKDFLKSQVIKFCQPKTVINPGEFVMSYIRRK